MTKFRFLSFFYREKLLCLSWFVVLLACFLILFTQSISYLDPDFGWHLRVGQEIDQTKSVPRIENYTYVTQGDNWVDHEWLGNYLMFKIYDLGEYGYWFLGAVLSLFVTITLSIILFLTRKTLLSNVPSWKFFFFSSLTLILSVFSLLNTFGIRLQVLPWFLWTLLGAVLFSYLAFQKKYLLAFPFFIMLLWTNLHGTFLIGLVSQTAFLGFILFFTNKTKKEKLLNFISLIAGFSATIITPYKLELWKLILKEYGQNRGYFIQIMEWLPMYAAPYISWYSIFFISVFSSLFFIGIVSKSIPKKTNYIIYFLFVFGTLLISIQSKRFLPFFTLASLPLTIFLFIKVFSDVKIKKWLGVALALCFLIVIPSKISYIKTVPLNLFEQNMDSSPFDALVFVKNNPKLKDLTIYNHYGWGGYFDWMWPEKKLFIDGRMPQKPLENGNTYIDEYFSLRQEDTMRRKLEEYEIEMVFVPTEKTKIQPRNKLEKHLLEDFFMVDLEDFNKKEPFYEYLKDNWEAVYEDNIAVIYINPLP